MIINNPNNLNQFEIPKTEDSELKTYYLYFLWYEDVLVYIGQTTDLNNRTIAHKKDKYFDKVTYEIFIEITKQEILKIERENINHFNPPYNDNEKGIIKTSTCALQRGKNIYKINKLYINHKEAYYYDGKVLQSITNHFKGYYYCEDGKKIIKIKEHFNNNNTLKFYVEENKLKCEFKSKIEDKKKKDISEKVLIFSKGKYKGKLFSEISRKDKSYIDWMKNNVPNYMQKMMK